jgi:phosphate/sulfate permease
MIGLFLIYFIGRKFYQFAFEYNRHQWLYAILGIVVYYAGTFVAGAALASASILLDMPQLLEIDPILLSLMAIPAGLLFCLIFYVLLKRNWVKRKLNEDMHALDGEFLK